jgi:hypothetical protein
VEMNNGTFDTRVLDNVISGNQGGGVSVVGGAWYLLSGAQGDWPPIQLSGHIDVSSSEESWSGDANGGQVGPWVFPSNKGTTLAVNVLAPAGGCGSVGPIWLNEVFGTGASVQITAGADGCPGPGGTVFSWSQPISIPTGPVTSAANNVIQGNKIGTNAAGDAAIANGGFGVKVWAGASGTLIGGTAPGQGNVIAFNQGQGVRVQGSGTLGNTIRGNSIHSNVGRGIENINGGNTELAPPVIDSLQGFVSGHTNPKCYPCTVDVFSDYDGQGRIYHGSVMTNDDATGTWAYTGAVTGPNVTATITDASGNTSEFSAPVPTPTPTATPAPLPGVGGAVMLPPAAIAAESSAPLSGPDRSTDVNAALAGIVSAAALAAGGWYLRRRWRC